MTELIRRLARDRRLCTSEYELLLQNRTPELQSLVTAAADQARRHGCGTVVWIRGAMEISSICKNDCLYCRQRRSNRDCERYRLRMREVLDCWDEGAGLGLQSFLLRGGEDGFYNDGMLESLILRLKDKYPHCALTLALGERSGESYERLFNAGADRYLLRHEAADRGLYESLHPREMSYDSRMHCLNTLQDIGYQTGCGFIVGLPGQTEAHLAKDLKYIEEFQPQIVDIGPFQPQPGTPFAGAPAGSQELTDLLISLIRLICPNALIAAAGDPVRRVHAGANVVCYPLYPDLPSPESLAALRRSLADAGYPTSTERGDWQEG